MSRRRTLRLKRLFEGLLPARPRRSTILGVPARWAYAGGGVFLAALLLGNQGFRAWVANWTTLRRLEGELAGLKAEEERLQGRIEAVRSDDLVLERTVRKELGYLKPGEIEYRFPPPGK